MYLSIEAISAEVAYRREGMRGFGRKRRYTSPTIKTSKDEVPAPRTVAAPAPRTTDTTTETQPLPARAPEPAHGGPRRAKHSGRRVKV
ncbi:hypothetical protein [Phytoactinopolyspora mesophila]|uniref:Uncharacterized protein n=1 Tax=Phytoactinopolyspora mesophila TaxID=2650750 RepID=A0A7K3M5X0_9ACTN|nr:hypothetical protein [Phytoactinopolyspora mesophila]NDL58724.1 hypothetical protein [Phytoactinopolyspora mesophila]